ncbi:MAG: hypothetical protein ACOC2U_02890 [bacterium]
MIIIFEDSMSIPFLQMSEMQYAFKKKIKYYTFIQHVVLDECIKVYTISKGLSVIFNDVSISNFLKEKL